MDYDEIVKITFPEVEVIDYEALVDMVKINAEVNWEINRPVIGKTDITKTIMEIGKTLVRINGREISFDSEGLISLIL